MGGILEPDQAELSHLCDLHAGMEEIELIALRASEVAQARHEHELMMSLLEISWEQRDGQLYSAQYQRYFSDIVNPPESRRTEGYVPLRPHVLENLFTAERLIVTGAVTTLCIISPSIDFQHEGSTKGQCYFWRIENGLVRAVCSDHSQSTEQLRAEVTALYGTDLNKSLGGNTINGGGVFAATRNDTPTRAEVAEIIRNLGNENLARQYEHASVYNEDLTPGEYLVELTRRELAKLHTAFKEAGVDPEKDPRAALQITELITREALQTIKTNASSISKELIAETQSAILNRQAEHTTTYPSHPNSALSSPQGIPTSSSWVETGASRLSSLSYFPQTISHQSAAGTELTEKESAQSSPERGLSLVSSIDPVRYRSDSFYQFVRNAEQERVQNAPVPSSSITPSTSLTPASVYSNSAVTSNSATTQPSSSQPSSTVSLTNTWSDKGFSHKKESVSSSSSSSMSNHFTRASAGRSLTSRSSPTLSAYSMKRSASFNSPAKTPQSSSVSTENPNTLRGLHRAGSTTTKIVAGLHRNSKVSSPVGEGALSYKRTKVLSTSLLAKLRVDAQKESRVSRATRAGLTMHQSSLSSTSRRQNDALKIASVKISQPFMRTRFIEKIAIAISHRIQRTSQSRIRNVTEKLQLSIRRLSPLKQPSSRTSPLNTDILSIVRGVRAKATLPSSPTPQIFKSLSFAKLQVLFKPILQIHPIQNRLIQMRLRKTQPQVGTQRNAPVRLSVLLQFLSGAKRRKAHMLSPNQTERSQPLIRRIKTVWRARMLKRRRLSRLSAPEELIEDGSLSESHSAMIQQSGAPVFPAELFTTPEKLVDSAPVQQSEDDSSATNETPIVGPQQNDTSPVWRLDTYIQQL